MDAPRRASSIRLRRPSRRALTIGAVALTVAAALTAWWLVRQREYTIGASTRARQLDATTAVVQSRVASSVAALAGVPAIVTSSGTVDAQAFESFGQGVLAGSTSTAVAYGLIVEDAQRAAFESTHGFPIVDRTADGSLAPAPVRARYCPIVAAVTASGTPSPLQGFDVCGEPERALAVQRSEATGEVSVTAPFTAIPSGKEAVSFYRVLRAPGSQVGTPLGFASFTTTAENVLADVSESLPQGAAARLADGDAVLFGPASPYDGATRSIPVAGRAWSLQLDDRRSTSHAGSTTLLAIALGLIGLLAALAHRTLRYEARLEDLTEAQDRDAAHTAAVATLAQDLSATGDTSDVLDVLVRRGGLPLDADGVAITTARREPVITGLPGAGTAGMDPLDAVASSGQPESLSPEQLAERWPDAASRFGLAAVTTALVVPLPRGTTRGAIAFGWTEPVTPGQGELDIAFTIAELVAAALARAQAMEESTARAAYETHRAELATALGDVTTVADVARRTLDTLGQALGFTCGYVAGAADEAGQLQVRATLPADVEHPDTRFAAPTASPGSVVRWPVDDVLRALAASPGAGGDGTVDAAEALVLPGTRGALVLVLAWRGQRPTGMDLHDVAEVVGQAVARARAYEREAATATALQDALLGVDAAVTGVVHAARYQAAEAPMVVGGDWYDLVADGDRVVVTVGDVVGRGLSAATVMGQLRSALRAALLADRDLPKALEVVDRFASVMGDECFATVAIAAIDEAEGTLSYCHAGHPPVLVVSHDGTTAFAEGARSWPIGVTTGRRPALEAGQVPLRPGDLVVLYTDGLVERRDQDIDDGLERLADAAGRWAALPTGMLCDRLLAATSEAGASAGQDDAVVLVVRRAGAVAGTCYAAVVPSTPASLRSARDDVAAWLATVPLIGRQLDDVVLAVHEATANSIEHGRGAGREATVRIEAGVVGPELVVAVSDSGAWRDPTVAPDQDRGRGILLMRQLMDAVTIDTSNRGTTVTMSMILDRDRAPTR